MFETTPNTLIYEWVINSTIENSNISAVVSCLWSSIQQAFIKEHMMWSIWAKLLQTCSPCEVIMIHSGRQKKASSSQSIRRSALQIWIWWKQSRPGYGAKVSHRNWPPPLMQHLTRADRRDQNSDPALPLLHAAYSFPHTCFACLSTSIICLITKLLGSILIQWTCTGHV